MEDKTISGIFRVRAATVSMLDADGFVAWEGDPLYLSSSQNDWNDYETNFGKVSLLGAMNSVVAGTPATYWQKSGTILSPLTAGDTLQVSAIGFPLWITSSANLLLGFNGASVYSNLVRLSDTFMSTSEWSAKYLQLATSTAEWNNLWENCGDEDVSLVQAINLSFGGSSLVWEGTTTNDNPTEIFVDGVGSSRYELPLNSTVYFNLTCIARDNVNEKTKVWEIKVVTSSGSTHGGSDTVRLTPTYTVIDQTDVSGGTNDWALSIYVNSNVVVDTLRVLVTGQTGCTIQWVVAN